ncbi:hydroxyacid-oxoacid transhydrogenase, mitochondrial-like [Pollicipes pollicipes]|uniref:hydroxyacid-oxoacid transhydrogenase, mitochondrial-like n=1 Tax=Pollicipes pollicipes TaxID=41117 RepID=UPI0018850D57|nr:hydroxyacid-oxoacid transhydrogenase, mitochondrial-like [Pollicipes pollicipes]
MASGRGRVLSMLQAMDRVSCRCPAHGSGGAVRRAAAPAPSTDYAFEMACSNIRYGPGVTQEVGMDLNNMGAKKVCVMTDANLVQLSPVKATLESLHKHGVNYELYDSVRVEPTNESFEDAIRFARSHPFDAFLAVGGGSVMDTAKAANLYLCNPEADFLDYVNPPIGKGKPILGKLKPLIAIPTTSGTGSETTGVAIFDHTPLKAKTGIANRELRPTLGLVDPLHALTMPERVTCYSGFDVLCHALESYTAVPFNQRSPRPDNPIHRPAYQGSNPISDVWAEATLRMMAKYFERSVYDAGDVEARSHMHMASAFAGIGFGNAGVHLCHGMSYPIAGMVRSHQPADYPHHHAIIPHGLSVVMTSPAVFRFTAPLCPERHLRAAELLGADVTGRTAAQAGPLLAERLLQLMQTMKVENGLAALGYTSEDIPALVRGTVPQHRVTKLAPRPQTEEDLAKMFEDSLTVY